MVTCSVWSYRPKQKSSTSYVTVKRGKKTAQVCIEIKKAQILLVFL